MANMAASMKGQKPELKHYLRSNKLPDIYEASTKLCYNSEYSDK